MMKMLTPESRFGVYFGAAQEFTADCSRLQVALS